MEGQTEYTGVFCYRYSYEDGDWEDTSYCGPFKETVQLKAGSLEDAITNLLEEQSKFIDSKNSIDANYYYSSTGEMELSIGQDLVYKHYWRKFTVNCVEEVTDAFGDFEHYNPLTPQNVYAADVSSACARAEKELQGIVDVARKDYISSGTFIVRTEKVLDGVGRTVLENDLRRV